AHVEDVGEVHAEQQVERHFDRATEVVEQFYLVKQRRSRDYPVALDLDRVSRKLDCAAGIGEVGIAQIHPQLRILTARVGIQQIGRFAGETQLEATEITRVAVKETERFLRHLEDVAGRVENREALAVDEHARKSARRNRRGMNVKLREFNDACRRG